jgi:RNA polymerase sigma-70 factor (ECF subfamily)
MTAEPPDTQYFLDRARGGEPAALAALFDRHRERVRQAVALRLDRRLAARVGISDVVQDTYLEATRRFPGYLRQPALPFGLWLLWLARERVLALHRRHLYADKRAVGREALPLPTDSSAQLVRGLLGREPSPSQAVLAAEVAEKLRQALDRLEEEERDLILWRHFEQLKNQEIARLLGITEAAAAKRYVRAAERLRGLLSGLGVFGPE